MYVSILSDPEAPPGRNALNEGVDSAMPDIHAEKDQLQIYREQFDELCQQNDELLSENQKLGAQIAGYEEKIAGLSQEITDQKEQTAKFSKQAADLQAQLAGLTQDGLRDKEQLTKLTEEIAGYRRHARSFLPPLLLLLALAAVGAAGSFYVRMRQFEASSEYERTERIHAQALLEQAQDTHAKTREAIEKAARAALKHAPNAQAVSDAALDQLLKEVYGYASDSLYADKSIILMDAGQTESLTVYNPTYYMFATASDSKAISLEQDDPSLNHPEVAITAQRSGMFRVRCAAYSDRFQDEQHFLEAFEVLVIVR